jgi:hypothetical protein
VVPAPARFVPAPEDEAAIPRPIGLPPTQDLATPTRAIPPPRKRRLGKLELAIIVFLGFDVLLVAAWKLFARDKPEEEVAALDETSAAAASDTPGSTPAPVPEPETPIKPEPEPEPAPEPEPTPEPEPKPPPLDPNEIIAAELGTPDSPGPSRPMAKTLSDKAFRESFVEAREEIVKRCLDSRMRRTLKVSLVVKPNGEVEYARVVGDLSDTQLGKCVVKQVYRIQFQPTYEGGSHTYALRLQ